MVIVVTIIISLLLVTKKIRQWPQNKVKYTRWWSWGPDPGEIKKHIVPNQLRTDFNFVTWQSIIQFVHLHLREANLLFRRYIHWNIQPSGTDYIEVVNLELTDMQIKLWSKLSKELGTPVWGERDITQEKLNLDGIDTVAGNTIPDPCTTKHHIGPAATCPKLEFVRLYSWILSF